MTVPTTPPNGNKVQAKGQPLPPWPKGKSVPISETDVERSLADWDDAVPEAKGLLQASAWDIEQDGPEPKRRSKESIT